MRREDAALQGYIDTGRLGDWYLGIVDASQRSVEAERVAEEVEAKRMADVEQAMRESLRLTNGHADKAADGGSSMNGDAVK